MLTKEKLIKIWHNANPGYYINYTYLEADQIYAEGYEITDDWARALHLLHAYSKGGYISAAAGMTWLWRLVYCRCNVQYGNTIGNLFFSELLYTFPGNRNIPNLLKKIKATLANRNPDPELNTIFTIIKEKTGHDYYNLTEKQAKKNTSSLLSRKF